MGSLDIGEGTIIELLKSIKDQVNATTRLTKAILVLTGANVVLVVISVWAVLRAT